MTLETAPATPSSSAASDLPNGSQTLPRRKPLAPGLDSMQSK